MANFLKSYIPEFLLQYFPADKILHFSVSFILLILFFGIRKLFLKEEGVIRILAFSLRDVIIIGILKEIIDSFGFGNAEFLDLLADFSGLVIPIYLFFIIKLSGELKKSRKLIYEKKLIYEYKNSTYLIRKIKLFIFLAVIWFLNIFYLILKIPVLALKETFLLGKKVYGVCREKIILEKN